MSVRLITILSCFTILVILHNSLILAYPYPEYLLQSQDDDIFQNEDTPQSWSNIEQPIETPSKRDCAGFPCMYTHLSAKAGRASLYRKLARLIDDCISDLNCNPGRRKRSITSALELLTVSQQS
ncbi:uncharacterized protein LOC134683348 [Mytilus trossulus]|uniref:uncharacterized protein LOC134683348 n=1 Tax=Mytilus trossulus TaxID=6551 RepID=UPI003003D4A2